MNKRYRVYVKKVHPFFNLGTPQMLIGDVVKLKNTTSPIYAILERKGEVVLWTKRMYGQYIQEIK